MTNLFEHTGYKTVFNAWHYLWMDRRQNGSFQLKAESQAADIFRCAMVKIKNEVTTQRSQGEHNV